MAIEITDLSPAAPSQPAVDQPSVSNKAEALGLRPSAILASPHLRVGNERRSSAALKFFLLALLLMLAGFATFAGMLYSFYQKEILPHLRPSASITNTQELVQSREAAELRTALADASVNLSKASSQILRLQKQVDELRSGQSAADQRLKGLADKLLQAASDHATKSTPAGGDVAAAIQIASVIPSQSAAGKELWLLKERNRLTLYADQAIAEGSSEAMANLWTSLRDPELETLRHGIQAEIMRVQKAYVDESRLPDDYRLPVRELFPGTSLRNEAELRPEELIGLLKNQKQPVFVRARAAYVLGGHPVPSVGKALIEAMKTDPSLDVAREAHQTLQRFFGMSAPLFHVAAAEAWWQSQTKK